MTYTELYSSLRSKIPNLPNLFEEQVRTLYESVLREGDLAIDCGAHTGKHSLPMSTSVGPTGRVHAFEPIPEKLSVLRKNIANRKVNNIVTHDCALGENYRESLEFKYIVNDPGKSGFQLRLAAKTEELSITNLYVCVETIDRLFSGTRMLRFVKTDAEGHEFKIFCGAIKTFQENRPFVHFEYAPSIYPDNAKPQEIFSFFDEMDFLLYDILGNPLSSLQDFSSSVHATGLYDYWAAPRRDPKTECTAKKLRSICFNWERTLT